MLIRFRSPVRPPRRASLDLVRPDAGQLDDLVPGAAARHQRRSRAERRGSWRGSRTASVRLPALRCSGDARAFHESPCRPTTPGTGAPGATRSRNLVVGATTTPRIVAPADWPNWLIRRRISPVCSPTGSRSSTDASSRLSSAERSSDLIRRSSVSSRSFSAAARRAIARASAWASPAIVSASLRPARAAAAQRSRRRRVSSARPSSSLCGRGRARAARPCREVGPSRQTSSKLAATSTSRLSTACRL